MPDRFYSDAERERILKGALDAALQVPVASKAEMRDVVSDARAVHVCVRFHGDLTDDYARTRELMQGSLAHAHQGRGRCSGCNHQVYFDPGHPDQFPERKLCLHCLLLLGGARKVAALPKCPADPCPFGSESG